MEGKHLALGKLLNVPEFVQEELWIEPGARGEEDRPAQRDRSNCGLTEHPPANPNGQATAPETKGFQLRIAFGQRFRKGEMLADQSFYCCVGIRQFLPAAS
jgi:hypothetical protein